MTAFSYIPILIIQNIIHTLQQKQKLCMGKLIHTVQLIISPIIADILEVHEKMPTLIILIKFQLLRHTIILNRPLYGMSFSKKKKNAKNIRILNGVKIYIIIRTI